MNLFRKTCKKWRNSTRYGTTSVPGFKELYNVGKLAVFIMQPLDIKACDFSTLLAFVERLKNQLGVDLYETFDNRIQ